MSDLTRRDFIETTTAAIAVTIVSPAVGSAQAATPPAVPRTAIAVTVNGELHQAEVVVPAALDVLEDGHHDVVERSLGRLGGGHSARGEGAGEKGRTAHPPATPVPPSRGAGARRDQGRAYGLTHVREPSRGAGSQPVPSAP